jgi:hypothetical protein
MSLLDNLLSAGAGTAVTQLAGQFDITPDQAKSAISALVPALAGGIKEKLADPGTATQLYKRITDGSLSRFSEDPATLASPAAIDQGKALLRMVFGGGGLTQAFSGVEQKTGLSSGVLNGMLPVVMALLGGYLSRNSSNQEGSLSDMVGNLASGGGVLSALKAMAQKVVG